MTAGISYALRIGGMGTAVSSVTAPTCQRADGTRYAGGLELTLRPR
jgi:hypothetical protein